MGTDRVWAAHTGPASAGARNICLTTGAMASCKVGKGAVLSLIVD
jgi:hypothetical protein